MEKTATILLAEDDENDVFLVRRALQKAGLGHLLMHVANGEEAISYLSGKEPYADRSKNPLPGLLLLDLKMPVATGFDVLAWLRTRSDFKQLPVIILSGSDRDSDKQEASKAGAADYQVKPIAFDELVKIMQALDARWLAQAGKP